MIGMKIFTWARKNGLMPFPRPLMQSECRTGVKIWFINYLFMPFSQCISASCPPYTPVDSLGSIRLQLKHVSEGPVVSVYIYFTPLL